jgi:hypothetical protein
MLKAVILALAALILAGCETMNCGTENGPDQGAGCSAHRKF